MQGQGGCERRVEVFVKTQKKLGVGGSGRVWGVRVDVNTKIEIFVKIKKQIRRKGGGRWSGWMWGGGLSDWGVGWGSGWM